MLLDVLGMREVLVLEVGAVGWEVPGLGVCVEAPPGVAVWGEVLIPRVEDPPGMEEADEGGLRVVPAGGNGPALPPELVVAGP